MITARPGAQPYILRLILLSSYDERRSYMLTWTPTGLDLRVLQSLIISFTVERPTLYCEEPWHGASLMLTGHAWPRRQRVIVITNVCKSQCHRFIFCVSCSTRIHKSYFRMRKWFAYKIVLYYASLSPSYTHRSDQARHSFQSAICTQTGV